MKQLAEPPFKVGDKVTTTYDKGAEELVRTVTDIRRSREAYCLRQLTEEKRASAATVHWQTKHH